MAGTPILTTNSPQPSFGMPILSFAPPDLIPDSLLVTSTTKLGVAEGDQVVVHVPFIDMMSDVGFVAEGAPIPEADPDKSQVDIVTGKVAILVKASREQLLQEGISKLVQDEIKRALQSRVDWALINQAAPVAPAITPPAGLLDQTNTGNGGAITNSLDALIDASASVQRLSRGPVTNILASPESWAEVSKLKKESASNESLVGAGTESAEELLLSKPVTVTPELAATDVVVLNKLRVLSAYGNVDIATSEDYYFNSDSVALRATLRFGVVVAKPGAVVKLQIGV
jgi:HK97 family phage major capsid protein